MNPKLLVTDLCMKNRDELSISARHFRIASIKAFFDTLSARLSKQNSELLALTDMRSLVGTTGVHFCGVQSVPVDRIIGSEDYTQDFTRNFFPKNPALKHSWEMIDKACYDSVELPPIKLIEFGGVFFVRDGHLRVSVARSIKATRCIDAEVIQLITDISLEPGVNKQEIMVLFGSPAWGVNSRRKTWRRFRDHHRSWTATNHQRKHVGYSS